MARWQNLLNLTPDGSLLDLLKVSCALAQFTSSRGEFVATCHVPDMIIPNAMVVLIESCVPKHSDFRRTLAGWFCNFLKTNSHPYCHRNGYVTLISYIKKHLLVTQKEEGSLVPELKYPPGSPYRSVLYSERVPPLDGPFNLAP